VVKLEADRHRRREKVYGAPGPLADRWLQAGARWLHVVDLNAALEEGQPNHLALLALLPRTARAGARVQWGGGVRDDATLRRLLEAELGDTGARIDRIIVGTRAIRDWDWLERAARDAPERIVVAIDAAGREILTAGWQEKTGIDVVEFAARAGAAPIAAFLYTNVAVEGRGGGVDWGPVEAVLRAASRPVIFAGGISSLDDVRRFHALGAHGVVLGSALYAGRIDLAEAIAAAT
jgi:phosphoribosylformimino-5-aminoimidazole carboxamide ribotide isomerase